MTDSDDDEPPSGLTTLLPDSKREALPGAGLTTPLPGSSASPAGSPLPGAELTTPMPARDSSPPQASSRSGGRGEALPTFSANELISGRYKIVRFVAQGGMGEVYEAEDLELRERVALKTVRAEIAADPNTLERFKSEIHLAHRVTHPNVCRIFDVGHHRIGDDDVIFLTMELLTGETLADRLSRAGAIQPAEALPLVRQMAAALEAAHAQGIVHRDFKSGNVVLAGAAEPLRAVVTDFGLARGNTATDSFAASVSGTGDTEVAVGRKEKRLLRQHLAMACAALFLILGAGVADGVRVSGKLHEAMQAAATAAAPSLPAAPKTLRRSIAVLGFKNLSGRPGFAWLSTALSEMFGSELAAGEKLRVVSGEEVARMKIDLALAETDSLDPDTLGRIRAHSHSDFVVLGSFLATGSGNSGTIHLDVRLQDTSGAGVTASFIGDGTESGFSALVSGTAARLREKLGAGKVSPADTTAIKASFPEGPEALRLYSEGLAKFRSFDALAAKDLFEKAVAADPNHALAHSALASAWSALGYDQKAREEAKKAFGLSANLPREDRLLVQGRYYETTKEWDEAIETYRTLWTLAPDNLEYGLRLASRETSGDYALLVTKALRKLPDPAKDDPRIDLEEAEAAQSLGNFKQMLAAARRAAEKGKKNAIRMVAARAHLLESGALRSLGEDGTAKSVAEEAGRIYAAVGDKGGVATALLCVAIVLRDQGDLAGEKRMHEKSLAIRREIGDKGGVAASLNNIANVVRKQGDLAGAESLHEESLAIRREIGDEIGLAISLNNIGNVFADQGDLAGANRMYEESLVTFRKIGDNYRVAASMDNIAIVLFEKGDLAGAQKTHEKSLAIRRELGNKSGVANSLGNIAIVLFEKGNLAGAKQTASEALALAREIGQKSEISYALNALANALEAEGDLPGARKHHEEALEIQETLGEALVAAASQLALARLSIEDERSDEAATAAREVAAYFKNEKNFDSEAFARAILARALLEMRNVAGAAKEIARAESLMQGSQRAMGRAAIGGTSARVRAASGKAADIAAARSTLESFLAEATKNGWAARAFEIRLALGEVEMRSDPAAGRIRLADLETDARAKGFGLIARKAAKLAAGPAK